MGGQSGREQGRTYDRRLLLHVGKRNAVLELWEVERYGTDSFGDADYVSIYGTRPAEWHAKGIRLLGRSAVECTRDKLGDAMGKDIAATAATAPPAAGLLVIDPFAAQATPCIGCCATFRARAGWGSSWIPGCSGSRRRISRPWRCP
jgi:hypothetical protein